MNTAEKSLYELKEKKYIVQMNAEIFYGKKELASEDSLRNQKTNI